MWSWLKRIQYFGERITHSLFKSQKKTNLNNDFAEKIQEKYEQKSRNLYSQYVPMLHRKALHQTTIISSQVNIQQIEQIIKRYQKTNPPPAPTVIHRQDRARLLSILSDIGRQDGERKELEQLIFRRKEQEINKTIRRQEEQVVSLRQEVLQQKKIIEILEKKMAEPVIDTGKLYAEFRKRLEQQLHLERQRAGF